VGFVVVASLAFATGGALMKVSAGFTRAWPSVAVAALFVLGAFLLARAVGTEGLSTAYTYGLGVEAIMSIVVGMSVFGERLTPVQLVGLALIVVGVAGVRLG
jgi:multidrug transporter EmrE-like cation transporter